jgi:Uma2 family endonuclease
LREDLLKGFDPDSSFYIENVGAMRGIKRRNVRVDPPPDLLIEIEVMTPSLPRFPVFAAFGVPEVWRYDGNRVQVFAWVEGKYEKREHSPALPPLTSEALTQFLADSAQMRSTVWLRHERAWIKGGAGKAKAKMREST